MRIRGGVSGAGLEGPTMKAVGYFERSLPSSTKMRFSTSSWQIHRRSAGPARNWSYRSAEHKHDYAQACRIAPQGWGPCSFCGAVEYGLHRRQARPPPHWAAHLSGAALRPRRRAAGAGRTGDASPLAAPASRNRPLRGSRASRPRRLSRRRFSSASRSESRPASRRSSSASSHC
jgi:hypothetical protein